MDKMVINGIEYVRKIQKEPTPTPRVLRMMEHARRMALDDNREYYHDGDVLKAILEGGMSDMAAYYLENKEFPKYLFFNKEDIKEDGRC